DQGHALRAEADIALVVLGPIGRRERVVQLAGRAQIEHRVGVVVGIAGEARAVRGDDEEVPGEVHRRAGRIPDAALEPCGRVVYDRVPGAVEPDADDAAL